MDRPWVIVGCGYTGQRLARLLVDRGAQVTVTRRDSTDAGELAARLSCRGRAADLSAPETLSGWMPPGADIAHCAPPGDPPGAGEQALVAECARVGAHRLIYVSSTGVYPPAGGGWVDENVEPAPVSEHGRRRLAAETRLLEAAAQRKVSAVCLRAAGIYGPGRGAHARMLAGKYTVLGDGSTCVNRIHVDDLVGAILAAAATDSPPNRIYNVADDEPLPSREYADAVAAILGLPPPPSRPLSEASEMARAMLRADRRVSNARIKTELGWTPRYPTFREGVPASVEALLE